MTPSKLSIDTNAIQPDIKSKSGGRVKGIYDQWGIIKRYLNRLQPRVVAGIGRQRRKLTVLLLGMLLMTVVSCLEEGWHRLFEQIMSLVLYQRPYREHHWNDAFNYEWRMKRESFFGNQYCTLENKSCFNLNRCRKNPHSLYIYPYDAGAVDSFFHWANREPVYEKVYNKFQRDVIDYLTNHPAIDVVSRPDEACLFLPRFYTLCHTSDVWKGFSLFRLRSLPHWDGGRNHIIVDPGDDMYHESPADRAMYSRCASHKNILRNGYDIQTLCSKPPYKLISERNAIESNQTFLKRPLLASFKGSRNARVRDRLDRLNNSKDVVILLTGNPQFSSWEYSTMQLQSRFCLAPRGYGLHSYRLAEVMAAGCIPVVISDGYAFPEPSITNPPINWEEVVVQVAEDGLDTMVEVLRSMPDEEVLRMHRAVRETHIKLVAAGGLHPAGGIPVIMRRVESAVQRRWPSNDFRFNASTYPGNNSVLG